MAFRRKCKNCDKTFTTETIGDTFCSNKCNNEYYNVSIKKPRKKK